MGTNGRERRAQAARQRIWKSEIDRENALGTLTPEFWKGAVSVIRALQFNTDRKGGICVLRALTGYRVLYHLVQRAD
jgi:hypothetical protein